MPFFIPEQLSKWANGSWTRMPSGQVSGFKIDARLIQKGEMFVALEAERDGHDYIDQAMKNGASSVLVNRPTEDLEIPQLKVDDTLKAFQEIAANYRNIFDGPIVGITGSCGKTSTKEMLALLLGERAHKTEGNFNNYLGVPLTLLALDSSRSDSAVVEVGINHVGEMKNLGGMISPNMVLVTMIGESHLAGLKNLETVASEKSRLFMDSKNRPRVIFHADCLKYKNFQDWKKEGHPHVTLCRGKPSNHSISRNEAFYEIWTETNTIGGSCSLRLWRHESPALTFKVPDLSDGLMENLALSVLAASELGVSSEKISERLPQYRPSTLRGSYFQGRGRTYFVDCYNANPSSMKDSLNFFSRKFQGMPKLYVLGGMEELGEKGRELHSKVGASSEVESKDLYVMIGEKAGWLAPGFLEAGARDDQLILLKEQESARSLVEEFQGAIMLKGSRVNKLEQLLPSWAIDTVTEGVPLQC